MIGFMHLECIHSGADLGFSEGGGGGAGANFLHH